MLRRTWTTRLASEQRDEVVLIATKAGVLELLTSLGDAVVVVAQEVGISVASRQWQFARIARARTAYL